jgi:hypothetical protein
MKKIAFVIFSVLITNIIFSQNIVDITKMWRTEIKGGGSCSDRTETIKFEGDTTIDLLQYKKVYRATDEYYTNWELYLFIREDINQKVYFRSDTSQQEYLLYNFNPNINDTLTVSSVFTQISFDYGFTTNNMIVDSIDTILLAGQNRKRITLKCDNCFYNEYWIEGIGNLQHGILNNNMGYINSTDLTLLCVYLSGALLYNNGSGCYSYFECPDDVSNQKLHKNIIKIFPNPVKDESKLTISDKSYKNNIFELYDCIGNKITSLTFNNECVIKNKDYKKGMYFYHVMNKNKILQNGKLIIN